MRRQRPGPWRRNARKRRRGAADGRCRAGLPELRRRPTTWTLRPCGEVLTALGDLQGKLAAAHAAFLRRFDAADAHDADGYGSSSAWLAAKGRMTRRDARAAVRQMRQFSERPGLHEAVAAGDMSRSWADAIARWTRKLPAEMRDVTDKILLQAAAAGASLEDLATIAAAAIEQWRSAQPDPDDDFDFRDRYVQARPDVRRRGGDPGRPDPRVRRRGHRRPGGPRQEARSGGRPERGPAVPRRARRGLPPAAPRPDGPRPGRAPTPR